MPITCPVSLRPIQQQEFAALDYRIMHCAFESQDELGRFADEVIYKNDLALRVQATDLGEVRRELPVTVTFRDFTKTYRLDLVVNDAVIYEVKTEVRLASEHDAQVVNYLLLSNTHHGKLINFRFPFNCAA